MISLVRVDDRLIHGQVIVGWVPYLQASQIIVVNDRTCLQLDPATGETLRTYPVEGTEPILFAT